MAKYLLWLRWISLWPIPAYENLSVSLAQIRQQFYNEHNHILKFRGWIQHVSACVIIQESGLKGSILICFHVCGQTAISHQAPVANSWFLLLANCFRLNISWVGTEKHRNISLERLKCIFLWTTQSQFDWCLFGTFIDFPFSLALVCCWSYCLSPHDRQHQGESSGGDYLSRCFGTQGLPHMGTGRDPHLRRALWDNRQGVRWEEHGGKACGEGSCRGNRDVLAKQRSCWRARTCSPSGWRHSNYLKNNS